MAQDRRVGFEFTDQAKEIVDMSVVLATKLQQAEATPTHMAIILLCGMLVDLDVLDDEFSPKSPSRLWSSLQDLRVDPLHVARKLKAHLVRKEVLELSVPPQPKAPVPASNGMAETSKHQSGGFFKRKPKQNGPRDGAVTPIGKPLLDVPPPNSERSPSRNGQSEASSVETRLSETLIVALESARKWMEGMQDLFLSPYHLSLAVVEAPDVSVVLLAYDISAKVVIESLRDKKGPKVTHQNDQGYKYLSLYTTDMLALARDSKLDETIGRDEEIRRTIQVLCRRTKNSVVLLGEPGVGKTAVAEGLAQRMAAGQVPQNLKGTLYNLDLGALFAGAGKGEYEERVKGVIDDVKRSQASESPAILFIDELHLISVGKGAGNQAGMDAANLLKPELARGQFRCIGATTLAEYREYIEKDGALTRRFAQVIVNEPTPDQAKTILRGCRERYENHHNVWIMDQALVTAVDLAHRYLTARRLPDSAFDLVDEACASARVQQDLKPEGIEELEQAIKQQEAYIRSLERDNRDADIKALDTANQALAALKSKLSSQERNQKSVADWWSRIAIIRKAIRAKMLELAQARSLPQINTKKITLLEDELKNQRERLVKVEQEGPKLHKDTEDSRYPNIRDHLLHPLLAVRRGVLPATSPDIITPESVAVVVEKMTKIPVRQLLDSDKERLLHLQSSLETKVIGQPEAIAAVTSAIQISRTGLGNANRPIACLLFTGSSGTGKTLLAKALAEELFGQSTAMIRIDGSEYSENHSVSRLIGAPPGYVGFDQGGQLTEYVRRTPYCIVLLDEIEKTCPAFLTLFLQVMDEGRLTDGQSRLVDFRNTVIIMTSNVGADILTREHGRVSANAREAVIQSFRQRGFPVEFLNRIDEVVTFRTMSREMMHKVLDKHLADLKLRDGLKNMQLRVDPAAKQWLIDRGISPEYGARLLTRVIQTELLNPLARAILEKRARNDGTVFIGVRQDLGGLTIEPGQQY